MEYGTGFNAAREGCLGCNTYYQTMSQPTKGFTMGCKIGPDLLLPIYKFVLLGIVSIATPVDEVNKSPIAFET